MKKSKILLVVLALVVVLSVGLLVACDEGTNTPEVCEHEYGDWALVKAPTYETIGSAVRICNKCTCAETVVVPVLGNSDVWTAVTTSATHSSLGRITYTSIYGNPVIIYVDSLTSHVYDKEVVDERYLKSGADCEHAAVYYKTCECGAVGTDTFEDGKALGHNPVTDAAVPATCTSTGLTEGSHCARCGEVIVAQTTVAKTAHNVVDDRAIPATCTSTGLTAGKHCADCGEVILEQLPVAKTAHIAGPEATCTADQVCLVCGSVLAEAHHVWSTDVKLVYSSSSYQEEDGSVSTSDAEATEYHTRYCTICGINDDSSKVAHDYCEEYLRVVKDYIGHEVYSYHKCNDCGYEVKTDDSCIGGYVEYSWTESGRKAPSYTEDGYIEYTYMDYTCKLTVDRLVAPYEGKSYGVFYLNVNDSNPNKALSATDRTGTTLLAIDANGKGSYEMAPLRGNVTLTMGTAVSEKVSRITVKVEKDEDYEIYDGYVNHDNGMVVFTTDGLYNQVYVLTPYGFVNTRKITASSWNYDGLSAMAITYKATCDMGVDHPFNVFVNDGSVYFDVDYVGFDGTKVEANACYNTSFTVVDSADNTVIAYAYDGEAQHVADGAQGVYTTTLGSDLVKITLDGCGRFVTDNALVGVYTLVSDADYDVEMYVLTDGAATAYYLGTFDATTATITATYPVATINFELGGKGNAIEAVTQNLNIPYTLTDAEPNDEKYTFVGWYTDSECTDSTKLNGTVTVTSTDSVTVYAKWSDVKVTINIHDSVNGDQTIYAVPGDVFEDKLPEYAIGDFFGFNIFDGWYEDDEYENPFDETETATASDLTVDVYAKYNQAGDWTMTVGGDGSTEYPFSYNNGVWSSTNQGIGDSKSLMEITAVGGPISVNFTYYASSEAEAKWDYLSIYYDDVEGGRPQLTAGGKNKTEADAKTFSAVIPENGEINFTYQKDGSGNDTIDTAFIIGLTINGVTIVNTNSPDHKEGTYTADGKDNLVLNGYGSFTMGDTTGSYELAPDGADCTLIAYTATETYKVTLTGNTYAIADYKVSVSFGFGTLGASLDTVDVYYGKEYTLPEAPSVEGHIFRNWSSSSDLNDVVTSLTGTENITIYAKYDVIVTLTYKYNDGVTADTTATFGANDSVETLAEASETVEGKVFAGWYTQDGTETDEWGTEFLAGTTITANTTLYAKWITPSPFAGTYTMLQFQNGTYYQFWNSDTQKLVIDDFGTGTVTAWNGFANGYKVTIEFVENSESVITITANTTKYYGIYDATTGVIVRADSSTGFGSTIYIMVPYNADYVKADFTYASWNIDSTYNKLITFENKNNNNSVVNIFIADNKTAYVGATWSASDVEGNAITAVANVKNNANVLDITCDTTTYKYARNSSGSLVVADDTQATYTNGDVSVFFNGANKATFSDGSVGTYTVDAENANVYHVLTDAANYNVTVDKDNGTYTIADNKVTVTYVNDKVTVASETTYAGIAYTLPSGDSLEVDDFKFRGWYTTSDFSGSKVTSATLTQDVTYYAKYDAAVTLTFDYNGQGTEAKVVANKYVGDYVSDIPTVDDSVKYDDKVFAGWFLKDAEGNFTTEASTSTKLTGNTTYYAKWIVPAASQGVYKGFEIWSASSGKETTSLSTTVLTINATGSFTGARSISGTLSEDDFTVTNGAINVSRYAYLSDALGGIVIVGYSNNATSVGTDYYIGFKNYANITKVEYSANSFNGIYTTWMTVAYTENGDAKTMNLFIYQDVITANVTWRSEGSDVSAKACANTSNLVMYDASGNAFLKKSGSTMLGNDGKAGTYTGDYGEVVIDGYGTLTIGETSVAYTLDGNNVTYVMNNATRLIALGEGTYTKVQDGYQGTYTLPDETTLTLDGYGNAGTKTYVLNGASITVYDGDDSVQYGIDVDNKTFLGKSVFAGLTFTGTYYDEWDESNNSISFEFDDTSVISGVLVRGVYKVKFTATFDGTTLTMSMTENVAYASDWVGKTLVATLSGNTFTITSWYKTSGTYTFANQGTLTCAEYAG